MLMTLASSFMTATRMDGFTYAGTAPARATPATPARSLAGRVLAALGLLSG